MTITEKARMLAMIAHDGQFRRDGVTPYFTHPEAVAAMVEERLKPIAYLHDVLEDTEVDLQTLRGLFPAEIWLPVTFLPRVPTCPYDFYIECMIERARDQIGRDAITVKIADMKHNLSCDPSENSKAKITKWLPILEAAVK